MTSTPPWKPYALLRAVALAPARVAYTLWALLAFMVVGLSALLLLTVLPDVTWRRATARAGARLFLRLAGMPLTVRGIESVTGRTPGATSAGRRVANLMISEAVR